MNTDNRVMGSKLFTKSNVEYPSPCSTHGNGKSFLLHSGAGLRIGNKEYLLKGY